VTELSVQLAARMLVVSGVEPDDARAEARIRAALSDGSGFEKLKEIVENQGGDPRSLDDVSLLPSAPDRDFVRSPREGYVAALKAESVGRAAVALGAGRDRLEAAIDPGVGILVVAPQGTKVRQGDPVFEIQHRAGRGLADARRLLQQAIVIDAAAAAPPPLIIDRILGAELKFRATSRE
jgi:pyrimidine-nucleoside phosphorylase